MGVTVTVTAYAGENSPEFKKHFKAVQFCIENELSFPKETSEFFKGKVGGSNLEDIRSEHIIEYIENGIEVDLPLEKLDQYGNGYIINTKEIPEEVDKIIVKLS